MDHRLGYPAVLRALFGAPAARMLPVYAAWPPIGGTTEGDKASTAEHDAKNAPKPVKRDEPYRPEFDFQYVDRKGHLSDTVIPKREAPSTFKDREPESIITPLAPSAGVVADAPTEWQSVPPSERGWFNALDNYDRAHLIDYCARYWNGSAWGSGVAQGTDAETKIEFAGRKAFPRGLGIDADIRWRGPRLVGDAWPEPQA